jgi:hypothetical protein
VGVDRRIAALAYARRALPGYDRWLESRDWDPGRGWPPPTTSKRDAFGTGLSSWLPPGPIFGAQEIITSSGLGGKFSLGLVPPGAGEALAAQVDGILAGLGADEHEPGLLVNCLPQGISVPPGRATLANCGTNVAAALAVLRDVAPRQGACLLVGEPILLKELIERGAASGPEWAPERILVVTGGEWVAESLRRHLEALLPSGAPGILVSCGAAELGLHAFAEDPALRALRGALAEEPRLRIELLGADPGFAPLLLGYDPARLLVERPADGEPRLIVTTLDERPFPLVRYDLGDRAVSVDPGLAREIAAREGLPESPAEALVAHEGRAGTNSTEVPGPGVEMVKEALFEDSGWARALTGRFRLTIEPHGQGLDIELHDPLPAGAVLPDAESLGGRLHVGPVRLLPTEAYPHHSGGHGRKPQYRKEHS